MTGMMRQDILKIIRQRRSIRRFTAQKIPYAMIKKILEAGTWAPSGMNNQPWRFVIVADTEIKKKISALTRSRQVLERAAALIAIFLDRTASYNAQKDTQAVGACIQNILLSAHSLGIGACWVGEILKNRNTVRRLCALPAGLELQAAIALGYPAEKPRSKRKSLDSLILKAIM